MALGGRSIFPVIGEWLFEGEEEPKEGEEVVMNQRRLNWRT